MNIVKRELKAHRKSLIIWCIGVLAMVAAGMSKYAGLSTSGQSMNDLLEQMPKALQAIMGLGTLDISTPTGYYGILYIYLLLMATIHAVMLGATIISKEERDKTSEFLFVKPVSRKQIIFSKLVAAFINIVIFNLVTLFSSILIVGNYSDGESISEDILITMAGMFLLQVLFLVIGSAIASIYKKPKKAASFSTGILLLTFVLSVIIDLNEKMEVLKFFTPFKYFEAKNVMFGAGLDTFYIFLSLILITILAGITFTFYSKKDLNT